MKKIKHIKQLMNIYCDNKNIFFVFKRKIIVRQDYHKNDPVNHKKGHFMFFN